MGCGNTKVSRILLSCNNIGIDTKDNYGNTALHFACGKNRIESVKLFLEHPTCNKDIVGKLNKWGRTAKMIADKNDNKECSRLIKEYFVNNYDRKNTGTIDVNLSYEPNKELLEFIN